MPRALRVEYPGAVYHLLNRGDRRQDIFGDDDDRRRFLAALGEASGKTEWQVHAYCLMRHHFHLVVETPQPNLVAGMKWLLGVYARRYNFRHKVSGHLFGGRYKALYVDGRGTGYLRTVCDYVHLNPVRAGLIQPAARLESFRWSSYPSYLAPPGQRPPWLRVDRLLGEHGIERDNSRGRRQFALRLEERRAAEAQADYRPVRRGWCLGDEKFRRALISAAAQRVGPRRYSVRRRETEEDKAQRMVREELKRSGWQERDLPNQPKGAKVKVALAGRLRKETTMTLKWIAARLKMGAWTYVSNLLNERDKNANV